MKKTLRFSLVAILAMLFSPVLAEDIIWSEDFSSYAANAVPTDGDYSYACTGAGTKIYTANLAGGTSPELLIGKSGGSFTATIPLKGKSGELTLAWKANYDRITVTTTTEGVTLGTKTNISNDYTLPVTIAEGTESITLVFTNSDKSNVRFDDVKLYGGTLSKQPAGISWGKASTVVTLGDEASYSYLPTFQNPNNLTVAFKSSDETLATVASDAKITVVGAGETILTATFEGNDDYEAAEVTFTLTVKAPSTGISAVESDARQGAAFNAAGQQVGQGYKGLVIKNGRKYIVK